MVFICLHGYADVWDESFTCFEHGVKSTAANVITNAIGAETSAKDCHEQTELVHRHPNEQAPGNEDRQCDWYKTTQPIKDVNAFMDCCAAQYCFVVGILVEEDQFSIRIALNAAPANRN